MMAAIAAVVPASPTPLTPSGFVRQRFGENADVIGGTSAACDAWQPRRGPFETIAGRYVQTYLRSEGDKKLRRDGVAKPDRPASKNLRKKGHEFRPAETYHLVSLDAPLDPDRDGSASVAETVANDWPSPEDVLLEAERELAVVERVREAVAKLVGKQDLLEEILTGDGSVEDMTRALLRLKPSMLDRLKRELDRAYHRQRY